MKGVFREPLVHFLLLGATILALFWAFDDTPAASEIDAIVVTDNDVVELRQKFERTWFRPPTTDELDGLILRHVDDEVLLRSAKAFGLDQDDPVIRQRLVQKMKFITESGGVADAPSDPELAAHLEAHPDKFERAERIGFEQVMLRDGVTLDDLEAIVRPSELPEDLLAVSLLPARFAPSPATVVDATFGTGFYERLAQLETDVWTGPVDSTYGRHMVRVVQREGGMLPPLGSIRAQVAADWHTSRQSQAAQDRLDILKAGFRIVLPASVADPAK